MATLNIPLDAFYGVMLIFLRVAAIVFSAPVLDTKTIPVVFKAGLAFAVSILLLPGGGHGQCHRNGNLSLMAFVIGVFSEIAIGVTIGLSVKLLFHRHSTGRADRRLSDGVCRGQCGRSGHQCPDPDFGAVLQPDGHAGFSFDQCPPYVFFSAGGQLTLIPPLSINVSPQLVGMMMRLAANMFVVAIKVGAPLIAVMLMVSVGLGHWWPERFPRYIFSSSPCP
jgi:flagellar biosynthetic protein FliR